MVKCVTPFTKQFWSILGVLLAMVATGMVFGFPSSLMPALQSPDSPIQADLFTLSWIASSVGAAAIPGQLISSYFMDRLGRKITHFLALLPSCIGWLLIYFAKSVPALILGRSLTGFTVGGCICLGAVVIGEYASPEHRGVFLNLKTASVCIGGMIIHILGHFFNWRFIALMALLPIIGALLITLTWPESPAWLASKGQFDKSQTSFFWLRGKYEKSNKELEDMIRAQKTQTKKLENVKFKKKDRVWLFYWLSYSTFYLRRRTGRCKRSRSSSKMESSKRMSLMTKWKPKLK